MTAGPPTFSTTSPPSASPTSRSSKPPAPLKARARRARPLPTPARTTPPYSEHLPSCKARSTSPAPPLCSLGSAAQPHPPAPFSAPGIYTLILSADDAIHSVAYDAVVLTASSPISLSLTRAGTNLSLTWTGGLPPFTLQQTPTLSSAAWTAIATTATQNANIAITNPASFFRVQGH